MCGVLLNLEARPLLSIYFLLPYYTCVYAELKPANWCSLIMSRALWDPGNLLQITSDGETAGSIQCVGHARRARNARCRWTIEDPERSAIYARLDGMALSSPDTVTDGMLLSLAGLCLCREYHSDQAYEVVERWHTVIERAAQHHRNLMTTTTDRVEMDQARIKLESTHSHLQQTREENAKLRKSLASALRQNEVSRSSEQALKQQVARMQADLNHLESELQMGKDAKKTAEQLRSTLDLSIKKHAGDMAEATTVQSRLKDKNTAILAELTTAKDNRDRCQTELNAVLKDNETTCAENMKLEEKQKSLVERLGCLELEANAASSESRRLAAELQGASQSEQESRAKIEDELRRSSALSDRVNGLQARIRDLEESVASCWWHAIRARFNRRKMLAPVPSLSYLRTRTESQGGEQRSEVLQELVRNKDITG